MLDVVIPYRCFWSKWVFLLILLGKRFLEFSSMEEFNSWKEAEEDATYTTFVNNQKAHHPSSSGMLL